MTDTNIQNFQSQIRKGTLEFVVLLIIAQGSVYTSDIITKLEQEKLIVVEGTIYPLLSRLKNTGLLRYEWQESKSGPPRKYYSLTDAGFTLLKELKQEWTSLSRSVNSLLQKHNR